MKKALAVPVLVVCFVIFGLFANGNSEEPGQDSMFSSSLHYTTGGMSYWYDKSRGGLETVTGVPYDSPKLDCLNCHISSCDKCHKSEADKKFFYSAKAAMNQGICLSCHKREAAVAGIDKAANQQDVHISKGMQCMGCHSAREIHGDGVRYESMKQQGVMDTSCEKCHSSISASTSHKIHGDKLECKACHVRHVVSCTNCHFGTIMNEHKRVDIKLSGWVFLMNYNGKVTSANMQTYVAPGDKTFMMFAPQNSHSIMKEGRKCGECHGTDTVKKVESGKINLTWFEGKEVKHITGVVPVVADAEYNCVYQNYQNGNWTPIENPPAPKVQYAGYGAPLSKEQLKKLSMPVGSK
jgi:hypothetical protein